MVCLFLNFFYLLLQVIIRYCCLFEIAFCEIFSGSSFFVNKKLNDQASFLCFYTKKPTFITYDMTLGSYFGMFLYLIYAVQG